jgi:hypothetical protein
MSAVKTLFSGLPKPEKVKQVIPTPDDIAEKRAPPPCPC